MTPVERTIVAVLRHWHRAACGFRTPIGDADSWGTLPEHLGLEIVPDSTLRARPSQQVAQDMKRSTFDANHVGHWTQRLGLEDRNAIQRNLGLFGVVIYRASDPLPLSADA